VLIRSDRESDRCTLPWHDRKWSLSVKTMRNVLGHFKYVLLCKKQYLILIHVPQCLEEIASLTLTQPASVRKLRTSSLSCYDASRSIVLPSWFDIIMTWSMPVVTLQCTRTAIHVLINLSFLLLLPPPARTRPRHSFFPTCIGDDNPSPGSSTERWPRRGKSIGRVVE